MVFTTMTMPDARHIADECGLCEALQIAMR